MLPPRGRAPSNAAVKSDVSRQPLRTSGYAPCRVRLADPRRRAPSYVYAASAAASGRATREHVLRITPRSPRNSSPATTALISAAATRRRRRRRRLRAALRDVRIVYPRVQPGVWCLRASEELGQVDSQSDHRSSPSWLLSGFPVFVNNRLEIVKTVYEHDNVLSTDALRDLTHTPRKASEFVCVIAKRNAQ